MKKILPIIMAFVTSLFFASCVMDKMRPPVIEEALIEMPAGGASSAVATTRHGTIGSTFNINGLTITLSNAYEYDYSSYTNKPGHVFLVFVFEIKNNNSTTVSISSTRNFSAYVDNYLTPLDQAAINVASYDGFYPIDGTIASGRSIKGIVGYEIPKDWQEFEVEFTRSPNKDKVVFAVVAR
jgi:Telomeric repeat-binding factor 2.